MLNIWSLEAHVIFVFSKDHQIYTSLQTVQILIRLLLMSSLILVYIDQPLSEAQEQSDLGLH